MEALRRKTSRKTLSQCTQIPLKHEINHHILLAHNVDSPKTPNERKVTFISVLKQSLAGIPADFLSWFVYLILGYCVSYWKPCDVDVGVKLFLKSWINIDTFRCDCQVVLVLNVINYVV